MKKFLTIFAIMVIAIIAGCTFPFVGYKANRSTLGHNQRIAIIYTGGVYGEIEPCG